MKRNNSMDTILRFDIKNVSKGHRLGVGEDNDIFWKSELLMGVVNSKMFLNLLEF